MKSPHAPRQTGNITCNILLTHRVVLQQAQNALRAGGTAPSAKAASGGLGMGGRTISELSISEISEALSSSNRSLLGGASWAVDISEIKFGQRLGAGAYGEVFEGEWRRSKVAIKQLLCGQVTCSHD